MKNESGEVMKCPKCTKGLIPNTVWFTRTNGEECDATTYPDCPHCDGLGNIQEDDVWIGKCGHAEDLICVYRGDGWYIFTEWDMHFVEDFEPQCRMKKVG